ncbi:MAG: hypothetical protein JSS32_04100 [Verrucomicrobia bacterium]|nr:hypothetical protein [Verrucomicrobiota bacterium]
MFLERLEILNQSLLNSSSIHDKILHLDQFPEVRDYFEKPQLVKPFVAGLDPECESAFKQLVAIGQADGLADCTAERLRELLEQLLSIDRFYRELGGIVGYQVEILRKLKRSAPTSTFQGATFHSPCFHDISEESGEVKQAIEDGIAALPSTAEFYPLGGAADRLHLVEDGTGQDLPAAKLPFAGRSLLEGLIRDVEAREFLYFQRHGKKIQIPIGIMTSSEKDNHRRVIEIFESHNWFGRPKELFRFFCQPLVPAVNEQGNWIWTGPGKPVLKPGGHGAIWKLARDQGVFDWLKKLKVRRAIVRQINNPLAGLDYGLLAFLGLGVKKKMSFGFVSCPRLLKTAEGVNVLVEWVKGKKVERVLTNIEYCDFSRYGIDDAPLKAGEPYSRFTCNTNILFADLKELEKAVDLCPFPGLLINLKKGSFLLETGEKKEEVMARLESTMQNIADVFIEKHSPSDMRETKKTFVTYNHRGKTISATKKAYVEGGSLQETPERCFYDWLQASRDLLEKRCRFSLPAKRTIEEMQKLGPECLFLYHPSLGPLYSIIEQKLRRGQISSGSELQLEIARADIEDLQLDGSLRIVADLPMEAQCILHRVEVVNRGVDWSRSAPYWKYQLARNGSALIHLKGRSEFIAEDVSMQGEKTWVVEDGIRMILLKDGSVKKEPI